MHWPKLKPTVAPTVRMAPRPGWVMGDLPRNCWYWKGLLDDSKRNTGFGWIWGYQTNPCRMYTVYLSGLLEGPVIHKMPKSWLTLTWGWIKTYYRYHGGMNIHLPSFAVVRSPIVCLFSLKPTQWISCFYMFVGFNQSVFFVSSLFSILMSCHFLVFSCYAYAVQNYQNLLLSPQSTMPCSLVPSISGGRARRKAPRAPSLWTTTVPKPWLVPWSCILASRALSQIAGKCWTYMKKMEGKHWELDGICILYNDIYIYNGYKHVISIYPGTISNVP